jgi:hypothetical protein
VSDVNAGGSKSHAGAAGGSDLNPWAVNDTRDGTGDVASGSSCTAQQEGQRTPPGKPRRPAVQPASAPDVPAAPQRRHPTSLYTSTLEHGVMSVKVSFSYAWECAAFCILLDAILRGLKDICD